MIQSSAPLQTSDAYKARTTSAHMQQSQTGKPPRVRLRLARHLLAFARLACDRRLEMLLWTQCALLGTAKAAFLVFVL